MKLLFDLFPIILFFAAYKMYDIFVATAVAMVAAVAQITIYWLKNRSFEKAHVITLVFLLVFGGLTIFLRDPEFLMWKVSLINLLFALGFIGSYFVGNKTLIERMMSGQISLPKNIWNRLNWMWSALFILIAALNAYFVIAAVKARDAFLAGSNVDSKTALNTLDCKAYNSLQSLCDNAQHTEEVWVNFKLFGTMGLTIMFVFLTAAMISKYVEE